MIDWKKFHDALFTACTQCGDDVNFDEVCACLPGEDDMPPEDSDPDHERDLAIDRELDAEFEARA